ANVGHGRRPDINRSVELVFNVVEGRSFPAKCCRIASGCILKFLHPAIGPCHQADNRTSRNATPDTASKFYGCDRA
ncbi:hypothetical protein OFC63_31975, partial [Escherichia coli]|nr:hypothetical protein [Escherichia coli]